MIIIGKKFGVRRRSRRLIKSRSVTLPNVRYRDAALFATFSVVGVPLLEVGDICC